MPSIRERATSVSRSSVGYILILAFVVTAALAVVGLGPFNADTLPFPRQSAYSDAAVSHWPATLYLQRSVQAGQWPLWRDLLMSGQPFAANPLNKLWYPPQWLALFLPAALHLNLLTWLHLLLAGLGAWRLGLRLGVGPGPAAIMGLAYALTPRLFAGIGAGHLDVVYAAAWLPWMLWAVHYAVTDPGPIPYRVAMLSLIAALCFLADIRLSVFIFAVGGSWGLWLLGGLPPDQRRGAFVIAALSLLVTAGLTAAEWLPLLQLAPYLSRADLSRADAAVFSLKPIQVIGLAFPDRFGFHETMIYAGAVVLILALIGFFHAPRRQWFWAITALIALLYAFGDQSALWPVVVGVVPGLLWLRVPPRILIVVILCLIILAGFGLQAIFTQGLRRRTVQRLSLGLIVASVIGGIVALGLPLRPGAGIAYVAGTLGMGALLLVSPRLSVRTLLLAIGALVVIDLLWTDLTLLRGAPRSEWLDAYAPLAQALHDYGVTRLYSPDYSLPQQAAAYWQIPQFGGVDPFQMRAYIPAFEAATGTHFRGYSVTLPPFDNGTEMANRHAVINAEQLAQWNVSHVLAGYPIDNPDLKLVSRPMDLYLYENTKRPTGIKLSWDRPNRFTATNSGDKTVNLSAWAPGWTVTDQRMNKFQFTSISITVAPGQTLQATYDPGTPGVFISILSALSWIALIVIDRTRR